MAIFNGNGAVQGNTESSDEMGRCCAKCRRGVPGFGILPCGYDRKCPNRCHESGAK